MELSRREALGAAFAAAAAPEVELAIVKRHDEAVERLLKLQITDPANRWCGIYPDDLGLHHPGTAGGSLESCTASFLHPGSRYRWEQVLVERLRLAAGYLKRAQNEHGNIDLVITNFNSPPDTAVVVHNVPTAACLAQRNGEREREALSEPFLRKAA